MMNPLNRLTGALLFTTCLLLTGCNIQVTTLGEGKVEVVGDNATACTGNRTCFDGGYNRLVELRAVPAPGYQFTGWAGACSGIDTCSVRTLGDRHVLATFKTSAALVPLMQYVPDFFFAGPWPSNIKRKADGRLDLTDFPVGNGLFAKNVEKTARQTHGFARNGSILLPLATHMDNLATHTRYRFDSAPDDALQLVNMDSTSSRYLERIPVTVGFHHASDLAQDSLLQVQPALGYNLAPNTTYGLILFTSTSNTNTPLPLPVAKSAAMQALAQQGAEGLLGQQWQTVQAFVSAETEFTPDQVAAFTLFTTQPEDNNLMAIKDFVARQDYAEAARHVHLIDAHSTGNCDNYYNARDGYLLEVALDLPNILKGKPPYLLSGGRLNQNAVGEISAAGSIHTKIGIVVPCGFMGPDKTNTIEIHALPTGFAVQMFWEIPRFAYNPTDTPTYPLALRVFIPAPYTTDREYSAGIQNLEWLSNLLGMQVDTATIATVVGDFNPLNLNAVEPQYLQYAMEMLYVRQLLPHLLNQGASSNPEDLNYWLNPYPGDFSNITFAGDSLGGLATLQANAIDPSQAKNIIISHMPRPNTLHLNNLAQYIRGELGDSAMNALEQLLGVHFPVSETSPFTALLQTSIDRIDPLNRLDALANKNLLLALSSIYEDLHGSEPAYSVATAIDLQFGIQPMLLPDVIESDFPFADFVAAPILPVGSVAEGSPLRILLPSEYLDLSLDTFTGQMAQGNRYDPAAP